MNFIKGFKVFILLMVAVATGLTMVACSKSEKTAETTNPVVPGTAGVFQGAGSKWKATFTTSTFVVEYFTTAASMTPVLTVNGDYVEYTSGFRKLTVTSASGTNAPAAGAEAYGFSIPGFAFLLKPIGDPNSEIIVMLEGASCPAAGSFNANWIIAKFNDNATLNNTQDVFGTAVFDTSTPATSTANIVKYSAQDATNLGSNNVPFNYTTCANGTLNFDADPGPGVENVDMYFTTNGGALVHSYDGVTHDSIIFAAPKFTGDISQADLAGTYSVLVFDSDSSSDKIFPAKLSIPSSGSASANRITDVSTDALSAETISIGNFTAIAASNGMFNAAIDPGGQNGRLSCAHFVQSSKKSIVCNGYGSATGSLKPFFFLARER